MTKKVYVRNAQRESVSAFMTGFAEAIVPVHPRFCAGSNYRNDVMARSADAKKIAKDIDRVFGRCAQKNGLY